MNFSDEIKHTQKQQVNESNIKWLEQSGAKVVPIRQDLDDQELQDMLTRLNGIVIPGHDDNVLNSDNELTIATKTVFKILDQAEKLSATSGSKLPVFGICLGMQQIVSFMCFKQNVHPQKCLDQFQVQATNLTLIPSEYTRKYQSNTIFSEMNQFKFEELARVKTYQNFHTYSITQATFNFHPFLNKEFNVITWSKYQLKNRATEDQFVTTIQHKTQPWYGIQQHIEKPMYEVLAKLYKNLKNLPEEVEMSQAMSDKFVEDCRTLNTNRLSFSELNQLIIYNHRHQFNKSNQQLVYLIK